MVEGEVRGSVVPTSRPFQLAQLCDVMKWWSKGWN